MAKLSNIKPRLGTVGSRFSSPPRDEKARSRMRREQMPWQRWYGLKRWKDLREACWKRDGYICKKTGVLLIGKYPAPDSPVANHIVRHNGDPALFWNLENLETISKAYHDSMQQSYERTGHVKGSDINGWPVDAGHPWNVARAKAGGRS